MTYIPENICSLKLYNKRIAALVIHSSTCATTHPPISLQKEVKSFPNPLGASPCPPPRAHPRPRGIARVRLKPHPRLGPGTLLSTKDEISNVNQITDGWDGFVGSNLIKQVGFRCMSESISSSVGTQEDGKGVAPYPR